MSAQEEVYAAVEARHHPRFKHVPIVERLMGFRQIDAATGCWNWTGSTRSTGYGQVSFNGRPEKVHRVAFEVLTGRKPGDRWVLHRCDNPLCFNPDHLYLGGITENTRDAVERGRVARGERAEAAKLTDAAVLEARQSFRAGESQTSIARRMGVSRPTLTEAVRGGRWSHLPDAVPMAIRHKQRPNGAILTAEIVREVRRRVAAGEKQTVLARELLVSKHTVNAVVKGRNWKEVV